LTRDELFRFSRDGVLDVDLIEGKWRKKERRD